jgi:hypothetical protein
LQRKRQNNNAKDAKGIPMVDVILLGPMNVLDSDGRRVGTADRVEGGRFRLTDGAGGLRHLSIYSVASIDRFIHLDVTLRDVLQGWAAETALAP